MLEHMRLAKMSFDLWGMLTPTSSRAPPGVTPINSEENVEENNETEVSKTSEAFKRSISQAELESSFFKVSILFLIQSTLIIFVVVRWDIC